jgi:hypothetical protein
MKSPPSLASGSGLPRLSLSPPRATSRSSSLASSCRSMSHLRLAAGLWVCYALFCLFQCHLVLMHLQQEAASASSLQSAATSTQISDPGPGPRPARSAVRSAQCADAGDRTAHYDRTAHGRRTSARPGMPWAWSTGYGACPRAAERRAQSSPDQQSPERRARTERRAARAAHRGYTLHRRQKDPVGAGADSR